MGVIYIEEEELCLVAFFVRFLSEIAHGILLYLRSISKNCEMKPARRFEALVFLPGSAGELISDCWFIAPQDFGLRIEF